MRSSVRRRSAAAATLVAAVALGGCGGEDPTVGDPAPAPTTATTTAASGSATTVGTVTTVGAPTTELRGTFGGDPVLEGGCAWLERPEGRYEVVWPPGYRVEHRPLRLIGPGGEVVATGGQAVTVRGSRAEDRVTICQVGPVFEAAEVVG